MTSTFIFHIGCGRIIRLENGEACDTGRDAGRLA